MFKYNPFRNKVANHDSPNSVAIDAPIQIVVARSRDVSAREEKQPLEPANVGALVDENPAFDKNAWDFSLQEGVLMACGFAYKFFTFWVAMALLVAVTDDHPWVENFKLFVLYLACLVTVCVVAGINNFMGKKFVFYKLLRHRVVLQFEHKPPARLFGLLPCPGFCQSNCPSKFLEAASLMLMALTGFTFIVGIAIFCYSATDGYRGGFRKIQFAKLGGTIGGSLAAVAILLQYSGLNDIYKNLIPLNVILDEDPQNYHTAPVNKAWIQGLTCVKESDFKRFAVADLYKPAVKRSAATATAASRSEYTFKERYRRFAVILHQNPTAEGYAVVAAPSSCMDWISFKWNYDWFMYQTLCSSDVGDDAAEQGFGSRVLNGFLKHCCCCCFSDKSSSIATACTCVLLLLAVASGYGLMQNVAQKPIICPVGYTCILNDVVNATVAMAPGPAAAL